ncbi:Uncharacterised protein [Streptococcus equi subsp. zooepidemicus]|nr:Uncharacterised protein [Streptococcus equi subsp. zooepidemicus]
MKNSSVRGIPLTHNYNRCFSYLTDFFKTLSFSIDRQWESELPGDYAGNYLYGYIGTGFLDASGTYLKTAAGIA